MAVVLRKARFTNFASVVNVERLGAPFGICMGRNLAAKTGKTKTDSKKNKIKIKVLTRADDTIGSAASEDTFKKANYFREIAKAKKWLGTKDAPRKREKAKKPPLTQEPIIVPEPNLAPVQFATVKKDTHKDAPKSKPEKVDSYDSPLVPRPTHVQADMGESPLVPRPKPLAQMEAAQGIHTPPSQQLPPLEGTRSEPIMQPRPPLTPVTAYNQAPEPTPSSQYMYARATPPSQERPAPAEAHQYPMPGAPTAQYEFPETTPDSYQRYSSQSAYRSQPELAVNDYEDSPAIPCPSSESMPTRCYMSPDQQYYYPEEMADARTTRDPFSGPPNFPAAFTGPSYMSHPLHVHPHSSYSVPPPIAPMPPTMSRPYYRRPAFNPYTDPAYAEQMAYNAYVADVYNPYMDYMGYSPYPEPAPYPPPYIPPYGYEPNVNLPPQPYNVDPYAQAYRPQSYAFDRPEQYNQNRFAPRPPDKFKKPK